jgi:hypothetical protein
MYNPANAAKYPHGYFLFLMYSKNRESEGTMFKTIIITAALGLSNVSCSAAMPATRQKNHPIGMSESGTPKQKETVTSELMQRVLSEIEGFSSGLPSAVELSDSAQKRTKQKPVVAPVIVFKESIAIFDISNGAILLVENTGKSQEAPEIKDAAILFVSKRGTKIVGDINSEDTQRLIRAMSAKFQDHFIVEQVETETPDTTPTT